MRILSYTSFFPVIAQVVDPFVMLYQAFQMEEIWIHTLYWPLREYNAFREECNCVRELEKLCTSAKELKLYKIRETKKLQLDIQKRMIKGISSLKKDLIDINQDRVQPLQACRNSSKRFLGSHLLTTAFAVVALVLGYSHFLLIPLITLGSFCLLGRVFALSWCSFELNRFSKLSEPLQV